MYYPQPGGDTYYKRIGETFAPSLHPKREIPMDAQIVYPTQGLRNIRMIPGKIKSISEGSATLARVGMGEIPEDFYIEIGKDDGKQMIPCYVVGQNPNEVFVRFGRKLPTSALDRLVEQHANRRRMN